MLTITSVECGFAGGDTGKQRVGSSRGRRTGHPAGLRFITYLSPGIPQKFFEAVVDHVGRTLGQRTSLLVESRISGPERGDEDPFSRREADVGFMCAPSFFWLRELEGPPVELVGAAPVFEDSRSPGRPVYFSEVIARRESPIRAFAELRGRSWAYNDPCSLSGHYNTLKRLAEVGEDESFFGRIVRSGSHLHSMEMVAGGEVDAAAIDSNVLRIQLGIFPKLRERLRMIESWGPFPIQPVVVRSGLHPTLKDRLRASLLRMDSPTLAGFGLERFASVAHDHYASEERALRGCTLDLHKTKGA